MYQKKKNLNLTKKKRQLGRSRINEIRWVEEIEVMHSHTYQLGGEREGETIQIFL